MQMPPSLVKRHVVFVVMSVAILAAWASVADTERVLRVEPDGSEVTAWSNLAGLVGSTPAPFVWRRLLPDSARLIAAVVPDQFWARLTAWTRGSHPLQVHVRRMLEALAWKEEYYPVLFSGYFLIWLSILGFMYVNRALLLHFYIAPDTVADSFALVLGAAVLGGSGSGHSSYPYDLPHAFVFNLALLGFLRTRWWGPLAFCTAAYSKETAVLLPFALVIAGQRSRKWRWSVAAGLLLAFVAIRVWLVHAYPAAPAAESWGGFTRNTPLLARSFVHHLWAWSLVAVAGIAIWRRRSAIPLPLLKLAVLPLTLVVLAFAHGWYEERRAFLETLPIVGLIVLPWVVVQVRGSSLPLRVTSHRPRSEVVADPE